MHKLKQLTAAIISSSIFTLSAIKPASGEEILTQPSPVKINEFFYKAHLETNYYPLVLDTSVKEPEELDLETVLEKAIADNINLNIARADSKIAKWQFWEKFGENLPDIGFNLTKYRLNGTFQLNSQFSTAIDEDRAQINFSARHRI